MLANGFITKDGLSEAKVYPCRVCVLVVKLINFCVFNVVSGFTVDVLE